MKSVVRLRWNRERVCAAGRTTSALWMQQAAQVKVNIVNSVLVFHRRRLWTGKKVKILHRLYWPWLVLLLLFPRESDKSIWIMGVIITRQSRITYFLLQSKHWPQKLRMFLLFCSFALCRRLAIHRSSPLVAHTGQFAYMQFVKPIDLRWEYACAKAHKSTLISLSQQSSTDSFR